MQFISTESIIELLKRSIESNARYKSKESRTYNKALQDVISVLQNPPKNFWIYDHKAIQNSEFTIY